MSEEALVLASRSPRRRRLLEMLGISHTVYPVEIDEQVRAGENPEDYASRLAGEKARAGSQQHPGRWVLGADTVVVLGSDMLGKPRSPVEAESMLTRLAGNRHRVITAVSLVRGDQSHEARDVTAVWFRPMTREMVREYVRTGEAMDKAGSYAIQGRGAVLVERIEGDYFGVMGLPVRLVVDLMKAAGVPYSFT